jgi:hypothetical protein
MLGEYDAETTTFTALAGGAGSSPYTPDFNGRLVGLRAMVGGDAATSLVELVEFKLSSTTFSPNQVNGIVVAGGGLRTAPFPQAPTEDYVVDQEVKAGVPVTIEARNITADTPVTVCAILLGCFEV